MSVSNLVSLQDKVILHCLGQQTYLLPSKVRAEATKAWDATFVRFVSKSWLACVQTSPLPQKKIFFSDVWVKPDTEMEIRHGPWTSRSPEPVVFCLDREFFKRKRCLKMLREYR